MRPAAALSLSPADLEGWAKLVGPVLAVGGVVGGAAVKVWRWWTRGRKIRRLEAKVLRYQLDALRHMLDVMTPSPDGRMVSLEELIRQHSLICDVRRELWKADGNELPEEEPAAVVRAWLTRTAAIERLKASRKQDMFREGDV